MCVYSTKYNSCKLNYAYVKVIIYHSNYYCYRMLNIC